MQDQPNTEKGNALDIAAEMALKNPINDWFHQKFNDTTATLKFGDQQAVFVVRQIAYAFYRQGLLHVQTGIKMNAHGLLNQSQQLTEVIRKLGYGPDVDNAVDSALKLTARCKQIEFPEPVFNKPVDEPEKPDEANPS